jgi:hypothetical protein
VIQRGGLDIVECFHFFCVPFLARTFGAGLSGVGLRQRYSSTVGLWPYPSQNLITRTVRAILNCDFRLSRLLGSGPLSGCGLSICAICRRTSA